MVTGAFRGNGTVIKVSFYSGLLEEKNVLKAICCNKKENHDGCVDVQVAEPQMPLIALRSGMITASWADDT